MKVHSGFSSPKPGIVHLSPSAGEWLNKFWDIPMIEYYSVMKRIILDTCSHLDGSRGVMLSEES